MAVTKRLRFEIFRRDGFQCRYCGKRAAETADGLTVDHVVPVALGGTDDSTNLVTACADCNAGKSSSTADDATVAAVAADAERWAEAMRQAAKEQEAELDVEWTVLDAFWDYWTTRNPKWAWPEVGWEKTVRNLMGLGLTFDDLTRSADIALGAYGVTQRNRWRYFNGVARNIIRERQERARQILEGDA